jgi:hypothetical protein
MQMPPGSANPSAQIDPDAEPDPTLFGLARLTLGHPPLHLDGAAYCIHHARKLHEHPVAGVLYDPAPVLFDRRLNELPEMDFEAFVCAFLVRPHQPRIADHISG